MRAEQNPESHVYTSFYAFHYFTTPFYFEHSVCFIFMLYPPKIKNKIIKVERRLKIVDIDSILGSFAPLCIVADVSEVHAAFTFMAEHLLKL